MTPTPIVPKPLYEYMQRKDVLSAPAIFPVLRENATARTINIIGVGV